MNKTTVFKGLKSSILAMLFGISSFGYAQFQLNTVPPLNGGNGSQGITFGLTSNQTIILDTIFNSFSSAGLTDIWYSTTDVTGSPNISATTGWTQIGQATVPVASGTGSIVPIPLNIGLTILPGVNYRFFVNGNIGAAAVYSNSGSTPIPPPLGTFTDGIITIETGDLVGYGGAAPVPGNHPRQFNGGVKYTLIGGGNDASVLSVDSPTVLCSGSQPVYATIANFGSNQINSVTVNWEVNGVAQTPLSYTQLLDTLNGVNPNFAQVMLGSANFIAGTNTVKVYTSMPNGVADTTNVNDTVAVNITTATPPTAVNVLSATLNSATINAVGGAGTIEYEFGPLGFAQTTGTSGTSPTALFTISGLVASSTYDVYVRSNCGGTDASAWVGPITFNTAYGIPYFEDFELFSAGNAVNPWPRGWSSTNNASAPRWESEDATGANENSTATGPFYDNTTPSTAGGMYMYLETSGGALGDTSDMVSPPIYIDSAFNNVLLEFYYHMYGATMGDLKIYVDTNGVSDLLISYTGQQQTAGSDAWNLASLNLVGYQGKSVVLRFSGVRGSSYTSDMSIDDIRLSIVAPLNAGVVEVQSPSGAICPGTVTPVLGVKNFGSNVLNNVKVMWEVNGVLDSVLYNTAIQPGDTASVTLGSVTFNSTSSYDVKFFTKEPNGMVDPINVDDTLAFNGLRTGLAGTYTVDPNLAPSASNFNSLSLLSQQLSNYGVCGPTTVTVTAGVYTNPIELSNINGLDATNTLTIDGVDSASTIVQVSGPDFAALTLSGVDYVTVKNMTLEFVGTAGSGVIVTNSNHNTVSNCIIHVDTTTTGSGIYAISASGSSTSHSTGAIGNYNTFTNNVIVGGYYGIRSYGSTTSPIVGTIVMNNEFKKQYYYGAYFYYGDSTEFVGNDVDVLTRGNVNAYGVLLYYTPNFKLNENTINSLNYGAYIYDFSHLFPQTRMNEVINNMIYSDNDYGLYMYYIDSTKIYHNTIASNSTTIPAVQIYSSATIAIANYDMRNNILYSGGSFALRTNIADGFLNQMDYNLYSTTGTSLLSMNSTTYADLNAYVTANANFNANSFEAAPQFVTFPTDLHLISGAASDAGDNTVGITTDIDGDVRPAMGSATVDIGADEFTAPTFELGLTALPSPTSGCGLSNAEAVTIDILNSGQQAASNYTVGFSVDGGAFVIENIAGPLAISALQTYTFTATADLSVLGPHTIKVFVNIAGDNVPVNDTIFRNLINIPIVTGFPYSESFETGAGGWTLDGGTSSFALGVPSGSIINSASNGTQAWVTNLTGLYLADEEGYVKSPCLDFSTLIAPIISMDVYWNSENGYDGAVLQSSIDGGTTWQMIGNVGDPTNWYNDNDINGLYLGTTVLEASGDGWAGRNTSGSGGWVNATHALTGLGGQPGVIFRVAFGSDGSVQDEGFAFDNVQIYESPAIDVKAMEVTRPLVGCGLSSTEVIAGRFENLGTDTLTNFPVAYSVNGVAITPETYTDTLFPGDKKLYEFTTVANLSNTVQYDIKVWSAVVGDALAFNDTAAVTFTNIAASTNPYNQTFDLLTDGASDFSPINWTGINKNGFQWQAETGSTGSGSTGPNAPNNGVGTYIYSEASSGTTGDTIYLESTCIDITPVNGANSSTRLDYWYHMYGQSIVALGLDLDSAGQWVTIDTLLGQQQTAITDTFRLRSLDLSAYQGMGVTTFRFWTVKGASFYGDVAIDDFRVYDTVGVNARMDSIISPTSNCGLSATSAVEIKISNVGLSAISNFPVSYVLNGGTPVTETVTTTVIPGTSYNHVFTSTVNLQTVGSYSLKAYVAVTGDGDVLNDTVSSTVNSGFAQALNQNFPGYFNGFEGAPNNWVTYGTNNSWEIGTPSTFYINGPASGMNAYVTSAASNHNANELSYIETPCFDLSFFTATDAFDISFQALFKTQSDSDQVWMEMTMNNGVTWTKVMPDPILAVNFYNNSTDNTWDGFSSAGAGNYIPVLNTLVGIGGNSQVKFRFAFKSNGTNENDGFALDEFLLASPLFTGVRNSSLNGESFGLYPNPTRDNVTISFNNVETGNYNLTIEDVKGQKVVNEVITVKNSNSTKKVNTSQFEKGVYFVRLINGSTIVTKKLVVN